MQNSNVNPLNIMFLADLRREDRVLFISSLDSFRMDLSSYLTTIKREMDRQHKGLTLKNLPSFLDKGINIHYLTTVFLIDKYKHSLDDILSDVYSSDRLTKNGRQLLKDMLSAYSLDFKGFHQMMMKTCIFSRIANLKEYPLLRQVFSVYKDHPDELDRLLASKENTTEGEMSLYRYLHDPSVSSLFLKTIPSKTLFSHLKLLPRILTIETIGGENGSCFPDFLKKIEEEPEDKKRVLLNFLYNQNAATFVSTLTHPRRVSFYADRSDEFNVLKDFIDFGLKQSDACVFQNIFVNHLPKDFMERGLSDFSLPQMQKFYRLMTKKPLMKECVTYLRSLNVKKDNETQSFISYLNKADCLAKEELINLAAYMYAEHLENPQDLTSREDIVNLFSSFSTPQKGSEFILTYPAEFVELFERRSKEASALMQKNHLAHYCIEFGKTDKLFDLKDELKMETDDFLDLLQVKNPQGDNSFHLACRRLDKTFFKKISSFDIEKIKPILFEKNNVGAPCFALAHPSFRKWLSEHFEVLKEPIEAYETESQEEEKVLSSSIKVKKETKSQEENVPLEPVLPKICRICGYTKLFSREMKRLEASSDAREKDLALQIKEKIKERCTASRDEMSKILSEEWKTSSLDIACFELSDSQGTPYRVGYVVKNDRIMLLKVAPRRDFYTEKEGQYDQLMQEANAFLYSSNTGNDPNATGHQHE